MREGRIDAPKARKIDSETSALLRMKVTSCERPKKPTKRDLKRRLKLVVDRKGNTSVREVE